MKSNWKRKISMEIFWEQPQKPLNISICINLHFSPIYGVQEKYRSFIWKNLLRKRKRAKRTSREAEMLESKNECQLMGISTPISSAIETTALFIFPQSMAKLY